MSEYRDWKVGDRVVFVGYPEESGVFHGKRQLNRVSFLTIGEEYVILDMCVRDRYATGRWAGPSIFVGCVDVQCGQIWHHHIGFRKVEPRKTSIAQFEAMLHSNCQTVDA